MSVITEVWLCFNRSWSPVIGDPTFMGWFTVVAYGITAALTGLLALRTQELHERRFWICLCLFLAALTINKQLDLQSAFTAYAKCLAKVQGWYEARRPLQIAVICGAILLGFIMLFTLLSAMSDYLHRVWLAMTGLAFLTTFVAVRAASFHHFDIFIKSGFMGLRMNWVLELSGIGLILANAVVLLLRQRPVIYDK